MRKNAIMSVIVADDNSAISFNVEGLKAIVLPLTTLEPELLARAANHGLIQKVSDAAALPRNEDGTSATPADKHAAMLATVERLIAGDWNKRGEGTGESAPSGLIRRAFVQYAISKGKTAEAANAYYDKQDRKGQLALRTVPEIAKIMEQMKSERGAKGSTVNADALLAELG